MSSGEKSAKASADDADTGTGGSEDRKHTLLMVFAAIVLVAGLVALVVFGLQYRQARQDQDTANQRDEIVQVATQVVENAFSFDYRNVDESLQKLADSSTGTFLTEQEQWAEDVRTRVTEQKAVTTANVSYSAVEEMNLDAGDAAVILVFTAHSEREGQEDITGRQAMRVDLTRVDGQWKADAVNQVGVTVPVGQSSESVQDLELPDPDELSGETGSGSQGSGGDADAEADEDTDAGGAPAADPAEGEESTTAPAPTTSGGR